MISGLTEGDVAFEPEPLHLHVFLQLAQLGVVERQPPVQHREQDDAPVIETWLQDWSLLN